MPDGVPDPHDDATTDSSLFSIGKPLEEKSVTDAVTRKRAYGIA
jgi:hypothetical protein